MKGKNKNSRKNNKSGKAGDKVKSSNFSRLVLYNILFLAVGGSLLFLYLERPEIKWINKMLTDNYKIIKEYPDATIEDRLRFKLGNNYTYLNILNENTPDSAVILFPPKEEILKPPTPFTADNGAFSYIWLYSFVYPRRVVMEGDSSDLKITHIAVMNGWGYHKLNYEVEDRSPNAIFPVE